MTIRTSETTVTFAHPFHVSDAEQPLPAGTYQVLLDDEELPGVTFTSYRRVATTLMTPHVGAPRGQRRTALATNQTELDAALMKDRGQTV